MQRLERLDRLYSRMSGKINEVQIECLRCCVAAESPHPGAGMLTGFPFAGRRTSARFNAELPCGLVSTNPCQSVFQMEPFPTSVKKVLICVFATATKI